MIQVLISVNKSIVLLAVRGRNSIKVDRLEHTKNVLAIMSAKDKSGSDNYNKN